MTRSIPLQHWGATADEIAQELPGDNLISGRAAVGTRSVTIDAPPRIVFDFTLAYALFPSPHSESTRVVTRVRIAIGGTAGPLLERALLLGDGAMVRKQLLGLKQRAEAVQSR